MKNNYTPLQNHLTGLTQNAWKTTFDEIESILGFSLPKSARHYQAWWANNRQGSRHTRAWLDAGWQTKDLNFGSGTVVFQREKRALKTSESSLNLCSSKVSKTPPLTCEWNGSEVHKCTVEMEWQPLGSLVLGEDGKLTFPKTGNTPALYCFKVKRGTRESRYIGETDNLNRRMGNYRNPGPTQQTSLRMNALLKSELTAGSEIAISVISSGAWIETPKGRKAADLSSKIIRCLLENAAIALCGGVEIEMLNRAK